MARSTLTMLFFLFATASLAIAKPTAEAPAPAQVGFVHELENAVFDVIGCLNSVKNAEKCAVDLFKSLTSLKISVSKECCNAISDVGDKCFPVLGSSLVPILKSHCDAFVAPPSPAPSA